MKITVISILIGVGLIVGAIMLTGNNTNSNDIAGTADNVSIVDGKQIIEIRAKGGYSPRVTNAKAGLSTIIKMDTQNTFDCSSSLVIPDLSYRTYLPPTGETIIDVPPQKVGTKLQGLCGMGMYNFSINFN
ncbi:MAG: hypothetical protein A2735_01730 [Candidatus Yanofskybacteria bacterium RIFCSPHIGHO2_01_FULL_41_21]|uniref:EfeO-type cupredoxin-like domain-containing protein n=1 Tax=Candidatus Yanofskybacteria bacterium RIFCSPHIGHO2_01_FULL_41_21 TaxID=1802660 RepID=A0A1F8E9E4_9BACT|nr:MAG: hypothetical protein A2735_01730 [Candidatus Yanofskybacteria bacterium RIFCSPHIGHO2_01_FULL_41_21]